MRQDNPPEGAGQDELGRIALLRRHQRDSLILSLVGSLMIALAARIDHANSWAFVWFGIGALIGGLRLGILRRLKDSETARRRLLTWERWYGFSALPQGLFWGSAYFLLLPGQLVFTLFLHLVGLTYAFVTSVTPSLSLIVFLPALLPLVSAQILSLWVLFGSEPVVPLMLTGCYLAILATALMTVRRTLLGGLADTAERTGLLAEQEMLYDNNLVGMALVRDRTYLRVNDRMATMHGLTRLKMEGQSTRLIFQDEEAWRRACTEEESGLSAEDVLVREYETGSLAGGRRWINARGRLLAPQDPSRGLLWIATDITERKKAERQLAAREQAYRSLAETYRVVTATAPALVWATDQTGIYTFVGERGSLDILGMPAEEALGKRNTDLLKLPGLEADNQAFARLLEGAPVLDHVNEIVRKDGRRLFVSTSGGPVHDVDGIVIGACGITIDISDRQQRAAELEQARTQLGNALDSIPDGFALFGRDERLILCNRRYAALFGEQRDIASLIGLAVADLIRERVAAGDPVPPDFLGDVDSWIAEQLKRHRAADGRQYLYETADGTWIQTTKRRTPDGEVVLVVTDITSLKRSEEAVRQLAQHDSLTGLPNRRLLHDRLAQAIARARRTGDTAAVLLIDLDGFKPINDEHGHRTGDEVLRVVSSRLKECVRAADTVSRYGGDEFVVALDGVATPRDAGGVALKIIESVQKPIAAVWRSGHGQSPLMLQVGCSIGISLFPHDGTNGDLLIRHADSAMYRAKQAGRCRFVYYSDPDAAKPSEPASR